MERLEELNESLVRRWYGQLGREGYLLLSTDVVCHISGSNPVAGVYRGPAAIEALVEIIRAQAGGPCQVIIRDLVAHEAYVVALVVVSVRRAAQAIESTQAHVFELRAGRICNIRVLIEDPGAVQRFWA